LARFTRTWPVSESGGMVWSHKSGHGQEKIEMVPSPLCLARDGRPGWTHSGADQPGHKHILIGRMVKPIWQSRGHHDGCEIEVAPRASLCTCRRSPSRINLERTHASHSATMPSIHKKCLESPQLGSYQVRASRGHIYSFTNPSPRPTNSIPLPVSSLSTVPSCLLSVTI
jgi:hypothetical protein